MQNYVCINETSGIQILQPDALPATLLHPLDVNSIDLQPLWLLFHNYSF